VDIAVNSWATDVHANMPLYKGLERLERLTQAFIDA